MFVKPFLYGRFSSPVLTNARSVVRGCTLMAGETVRPSAMTTPLPNCNTPTFIASAPKYSVWYFVISVTAKALKILGGEGAPDAAQVHVELRHH